MEKVVLGKAQEPADVSALVGPQEGLDALPAPVRSAEGPVPKSPATPMDDRAWIRPGVSAFLEVVKHRRNGPIDRIA